MVIRDSYEVFMSPPHSGPSFKSPDDHLISSPVPSYQSSWLGRYLALTSVEVEVKLKLKRELPARPSRVPCLKNNGRLPMQGRKRHPTNKNKISIDLRAVGKNLSYKRLAQSEATE